MLGFAVHPWSKRSDEPTPNPPRAVVIIPARYASTRLPAKPLADICGKPMIEYVYKQASAATSVESVLVATDDERIVKAVEAFGGQARMTSSEHPSGTDRIAEVAKAIHSDLIVNVQADEPLIHPDMIDAAIEAFSRYPSILVSTLRSPIEDPALIHDPHTVKVATDRDGFAIFFSRSAIGLDRTAPHRDWAVDRHIGVYVYQRSFLLTLSKLEQTPLECSERLEQLRVLEHGYRIMTIETPYHPVGVDTKADLEQVRQLVAAGVTV